MAAGLEGLEQKRKLEAPCCENLSDAPESVLKGLKKLPENREEAVEAARNSEFIQSVLPEKIRQMYFLSQRPETPGI